MTATTFSRTAIGMVAAALEIQGFAVIGSK
jgi:hypothetical protein